MKKNLLVLAMIVIASLFVFKPVSAAQFGIAGDDGKLTLSTEVFDNYIAVGGEVIIDADIHGDLIIFAANASINANVYGNLIMGAGQAKINGEVTKNVYAAFGQVEFLNSSKIDGDVFLAAGNSIINNQIEGKLYAGTGSLVIDGIIKRGFSANSGSIELKDKSQILGDIKYTAPEKMTVDSNASITGNIDEKIVDKEAEKQEKQKFSAFGVSAGFAGKVTATLISLISALIVGIILLTLFPKFSEKVSSTIQNKFWPSAGWGLLFVIVLPIVMIIALILIVGAPLSLILLGVYWLLIYLAKIFVGLCLGMHLSKNKMKPIWAMTFGLFLLYLIGLIPIIGGIANFIVVIVGFGAFYLATQQLNTKK